MNEHPRSPSAQFIGDGHSADTGPEPMIEENHIRGEFATVEQQCHGVFAAADLDRLDAVPVKNVGQNIANNFFVVHNEGRARNSEGIGCGF